MTTLLRGTCALAIGVALSLPAHTISASDRRMFAPTIEPSTLHEDPVVSVPVFERSAPPPFRASFGHAQLYLPPFFHAVDGKYDVLIHFHGLSRLQEGNVVGAHLNAAVVSVNIGMGSGPYEEAFRDPQVFARLVAYSVHLVEKSGRAPDARLGRLAVSAWSAGYGSVASILRQPQNVKRLDAVLLEDAPHSDWTDEKRHIVADAPLVKYAHIAEAAIAGDKLFAITHSAIHTDGYPCSTDTVAELLTMTGMEKTAHDAAGPRGMHQLYESDRGDFHVKGYDGIGVKDHIDHIKAMSETVLPYLRARWER